MDRNQASTEHPLGDQIVEVQQRRPVVDEISVEEAATTNLPRAYDVRRFIDVDDIDDRGGPRNLDSGLSEISIVFQAAVPKPVAPKYTTFGVRRPSEL